MTNPYQPSSLTSEKVLPEMADSPPEEPALLRHRLAWFVAAVSLPLWDLGGIVGIRYTFPSPTRTTVLAGYCLLFPVLCGLVFYGLSQLRTRPTWYVRSFFVFSAVTVSVLNGLFYLLVAR